jgi:hypothetical protein
MTEDLSRVRHLVGTVGENDRDARSGHDASDLGASQRLKLLGPHIAGLQIRDNENFHRTRDGGNDTFGLGRLHRDRLVEGQRAIDNAAGDLSAAASSVDLISGETVSTAVKMATFGIGIPSA